MNSDTVRVAICILGVIAGISVLWACFGIRRLRTETLGMIGGALLCFAVSIGVLGVLLGFDPVWRLSLLAIALLYITVGRVAQIVIHYRGGGR